MALRFTTAEARDEFVKRLNEHAMELIRCFDQGRDGKIVPSQMMIDDIRAAAGILAASDVKPPSSTATIPE